MEDWGSFFQGLAKTYASAKIADKYGPKPEPVVNVIPAPGNDGQPAPAPAADSSKWLILGGIAVVTLLGVVILKK